MLLFFRFIKSILVYPKLLSWLDLSHNRINEINDEITYFQNLKILYLHHNDIRSIKALLILRNLPKLINLTLVGNPVEKVISNYSIFYVLLYSIFFSVYLKSFLFGITYFI